MGVEKELLVREILGRVADKWTLQIIYELEDGPLRFSVLKKKISGVSQKMLTQTLRTMESDGLVRREVFAEVPPRVEYSLTKMGMELGAATCSFWKWAEKYSRDIERMRERRKMATKKKA